VFKAILRYFVACIHAVVAAIIKEITDTILNENIKDAPIIRIVLGGILELITT
jgi:hypothetical protein